MKVIQLLLDGYNKSNNTPPIYTPSILESNGYQVKSFDSSIKGSGDLRSPMMWGRILYGNQFPTDVASYHVAQTDKWNAEHSGYRDEMDQSQWIWNQLPDDVIKYILPYYLVNEIDEKILVQKDNTTVITRNYKDPQYKYITKDLQEVRSCSYVNHMICDIFDECQLSEDLTNRVKEVWKGDLSDITDIIDQISKEIKVKIIDYLDENYRLLKEYGLPEKSDNMYLFLGTTTSDAIYHYCVPYIDIFDKFRIQIDCLINDLIKKYDPDVIFIHGDHNMKTADHMKFRTRKRCKYNYNGNEGLCFEPFYNKYPMYVDHGNIVGGEIYYKESVKDLIDEIQVEEGRYITDSFRDWLINKAYTGDN